MRIGVDIGGVIIAGNQPEDTSFFSDNWLQTPEVRGAFTNVRMLKAIGNEIFLISKAQPTTLVKTKRWLDNRGFFEYTGVPRNNLVFVRWRAQKLPVAQLLELDAMVDDNERIRKAFEEAGITTYASLDSLMPAMVQ